MLITSQDRTNENECAALLGKEWGCTVHGLGPSSQIDWFLYKGDALVGLAELKCRNHKHGTFPTVFLSARKWAALQFLTLGLGVKGLFVVKWNDKIGWIDINAIDSTKTTIVRRMDRNLPNDTEPAIEIPVYDFTMRPIDG